MLVILVWNIERSLNIKGLWPTEEKIPEKVGSFYSCNIGYIDPQTYLSTLNETLALLDGVKYDHHDHNEENDGGEGDGKDQYKVLMDILYASIVDNDVFFDLVEPVTGGGDLVWDEGRAVHVMWLWRRLIEDWPVVADSGEGSKSPDQQQ